MLWCRYRSRHVASLDRSRQRWFKQPILGTITDSKFINYSNSPVGSAFDWEFENKKGSLCYLYTKTIMFDPTGSLEANPASPVQRSLTPDRCPCSPPPFHHVGFNFRSPLVLCSALNFFHESVTNSFVPYFVQTTIFQRHLDLILSSTPKVPGLFQPGLCHIVLSLNGQGQRGMHSQPLLTCHYRIISHMRQFYGLRVLPEVILVS